jgi:hypothetical protein
MNSVKHTTKAYVAEGALSEVVVKVIDESVIDLLEALGFSPAPDKGQRALSLTTPNQSAKIKVFEKLRDEGVCFSAGPDWCPADVFEFLRDNNLLTGPYRKIAWRGPGEPEIFENC